LAFLPRLKKKYDVVMTFSSAVLQYSKSDSVNFGSMLSME